MESNEMHLTQAIAERDARLQALCHQVNEEKQTAVLQQQELIRMLEEKMENLRLEHERNLEKVKVGYNEELQKQELHLKTLQLELERSKVRSQRRLNTLSDSLHRLRRRTNWQRRFRSTSGWQ